MDGGGMRRRGDNVEHATKISTIKKSGTRMEGECNIFSKEHIDKPRYTVIYTSILSI
jgi:hypothetical protein